MAGRTRFLVWISAAIVITAGLKARTTTTTLVGSGFSRTVAHTTTQIAPQRPVFKTEANYVRVDAFPTIDEKPVTDLSQDEFEILEDNVPQRIDAFEHVVIRPAGPQETRREPNTVAESRAMAADPRARVFVIFLDTYHVTNEASHNIRAPLVRLLDRLIGPDDLVGVMTPEMKGTDLTLARKMITIDGLLTKHWDWGRREDRDDRDPEEIRYETCYPEVLQPRSECERDVQGIAREMILRRRERRSLDGIQALIRHLQSVREERKAIITVSNGWTLWKPNANLERQLACRDVPGTQQPIFIGPGGKLTTKPKDDNVVTAAECDRDRLELARLDNDFQFRRIVDDANRATATFYTIDPRGLAAFDEGIDTGIGIGKPLRLEPDAKALGARVTTLRTLAEATDGLAVVSTNDLERGADRIVSDLSSYYLLGYYTTNSKLDGKFRSITVRVKRPRVQVRARRGYRAPTAAEVAARTAAPSAGGGSAAAEAAAIDAAVAPLKAIGRDLPLRLQAAAGWKPDNTAAVWAVGEVGTGDDWRGGVEVEVTLANAAGATMSTVHTRVEAGARSFRVALAPADPLTPGEYAVRVRARSAAPSSIPTNDVLRVVLPAAPDAAGALFIRRGLTTGNKELATADPRFRRSEQLRVEVPALASSVPAARLLDRSGKPMLVPVTATVRDDPDGSRWQVVRLSLAPLAVGDYLLEIAEPGESGGERKRTLVAFRVVP